jgi:hypothetical protein
MCSEMLAKRNSSCSTDSARARSVGPSRKLQRAWGEVGEVPARFVPRRTLCQCRASHSGVAGLASGLAPSAWGGSSDRHAYAGP